VQLWLTASVDADRAEAVRRAKGNMAFYGGIAQYRPFFAAHGFGDVVDRLAEARRSLPVASCVDLVPDEMARTFVVCGDADDVRAQLERLWARADSMVVRPPSWCVAPEDYAARLAALEDLLLGPA
jgi:alkanesulfonate monooxygenase SsuD/methylene tetrahydromethanopterin reductase-like flavin-dependent oxidoreductase (luciferase family)